jgi:predicted phage terminase large subunit-like protein
LLYEIESIFEGNEIFRWLFDELIPDLNQVRWNASEMEVRRPVTFSEASIEALGVGGAAVSRHFDEQIKDDWVNEDHIQYPEQMQKLILFHRNSFPLFVSPARGVDTIVGTRWSHSDYIQHILDNSSQKKLGASNPFAYYCTVRSAIENGKPIFPMNGLGEDEFTLEQLNAILEDQGPYVFSCQYLNNPTHEDSKSFLPEWTRYYDIPPRSLRTFTAVDPATERGESMSAIATIGTTWDKQIYILEYTKANLGTDELIEEIIRHQMTYDSKVGMETIAFQKVLMQPLRDGMKKYGMSFAVQELKPLRGQRKEFRIAGTLQPKFANGSVFIRRNMQELEKDLSWFPATTQLDLLDALSYAVQMATFPDRDERKYRDPFNIDVILEELERKNGKKTGEPWIWNKSGVNMDAVMSSLILPPVSRSPEAAKRLVDEWRKSN